MEIETLSYVQAIYRFFGGKPKFDWAIEDGMRDAPRCEQTEDPAT